MNVDWMQIALWAGGVLGFLALAFVVILVLGRRRPPAPILYDQAESLNFPKPEEKGAAELETDLPLPTTKKVVKAPAAVHHEGAKVVSSGSPLAPPTPPEQIKALPKAKYRAMISSTGFDLPEHLLFTCDACLRNGFTPVMVESLLPNYESILPDVQPGFVDDVDVYVAIFGFRYGSNPRYDRRSYTEIEFERVMELKKPVLSFFIDAANHPVDANHLESGEPAQKLSRLKRRARNVNESGVFASPKQLGEMVSESLASLASSLDEEVPPPEPQINLPSLDFRPLALPAKPVGFAGRTEEIQQLAASLTHGSIAVCPATPKAAGIGKTTLALYLVSEVEHEFADGSAFLDLRGQSDNPMTSAEAMRRIIHHWDPLADLPLSEIVLKSMYDKFLEEKEAILLLDNARDADQIDPLLPKQGDESVALVTAVENFPIQGREPLLLGGFATEIAEAFLVKNCSYIDGSTVVPDLAVACGNFPLALRLVAKMLAVNSHLDPSQILEEYGSDRHKGLGPLERTIKLAFESLTSDLAEALSFLSIMEADFDLPAAQAILATDEAAAGETLDRLTARSLIEFDQERQRYHFHEAVRQAARPKLPEEEGTARKRHAQHFDRVQTTARELAKSIDPTVSLEERRKRQRQAATFLQGEHWHLEAMRRVEKSETALAK